MRFLEAAKTFLYNNWIGILVGMIITFPPSVWAGHLGNRITERKNRRNLEAKQKNFIDSLSAETNQYISSMPQTEEEVSERRNRVAASVKKLSQESFGQNYPEVKSIRPENTEYPPMPCKWCHRPHKAFSGPRGDCRTCKLPLDLWMGAQGEIHKGEQ